MGISGNEKVVRARLSDAKFFWETDLKVKLEDRLEKLKSITLLEAAELVKQIEETFNVSATVAVSSGPVVMAASAGPAQEAEEKTEFDLVLASVFVFV